MHRMICSLCLREIHPVLCAPQICPHCLTRTAVNADEWLARAWAAALTEYTLSVAAAAPADTDMLFLRHRGLRTAFAQIWAREALANLRRLSRT